MRKLAEEDFWDRTQRQPNGCLLWTGPRKGRYGGWGGRKYAHHEAFERYRGWPHHVGVIAHTCDNTLCVEGTHLFQTTQRDNLDDMVAKDRQRKSRNPLDPKVVYMRAYGRARTLARRTGGQ